MSSTKCEICLTNEHKYKCPRCATKTCSLLCCKTHKANTGCTGERDKTKYLSKEEFDEQTLLSDYKYLEEQTRLIDSFQRSIEQKDSPLNADGSASKSAPQGAFENMRKFVKSQFNINLKLMPAQSTRHVNNKTRFNRTTSAISWSLEFAFHLDQSKVESSLKSHLFRFHTKSCLFASSETIREVLAQMYAKFKGALFENISENDSSVCLIKTFAGLFKEQNFADVHVLFEMSNFTLKKKYFVRFGLDQKLDECLRNKSLIEYPTLYLVTANDLDKYFIHENEEISSLQSKNHDINEEKDETNDKTEDVDENCESDKSTSDSEEFFHKNADSSQAKSSSDLHDEESPTKKFKEDNAKNGDSEIEEGEEVDSD